MPDRGIYKGATPVPGVEGGNIDIRGFHVYFYNVQVFLNRSRGMSTREESGVSPNSSALAFDAFGNGAQPPWSGSGSLIGNPV